MQGKYTGSARVVDAAAAKAADEARLLDLVE